MKISVVTASYNCIGTIADAIRSVAEQSYAAVEHVVVDGASSDGTWQVIEALRSPRMVAHSEPDRGIYDALNKGIKRASGEVIGFLHADDVFAHPDVLSWVAQAFTNPAVDVVYGDLEYVRRDSPNQVVRHWHAGSFSIRRLAWGWMPPHPTLYVRREWYERLGGYEIRYRIAADYHFILRLFSRPNLRVQYIPRVFIKMKTGGVSNRSIRNVVRKSAEDYDALRHAGFGMLGGFGALICKNISKMPQFVSRRGQDE